ncbi:MAG: hypothetical protein MH825_13085 [Cyanobacteria bacterium]|nr:hypothetical protein [Cyanobacteriota bacterium]
MANRGRGRPKLNRSRATVYLDDEVRVWLESRPGGGLSDQINALAKAAMNQAVRNVIDGAEKDGTKPAEVDRGAVLLLVGAIQEMVRAGGDRAATELLTARLVGLLEAMGYAVPNAESTTE